MEPEPVETASAHAAPAAAPPQATTDAAPIAGAGSAAPSFAAVPADAASEPAGASLHDAGPPAEPEQLGLF